MKYNYYFYPVRQALVVLFIVTFWISCTRNNNETISSKVDPPRGDRQDFDGAVEYEYNLIKNPYTGKIPEGVFEAEKAQARSILQTQEMNGNILVNSYAFQGPNNLGGRTRSIKYDTRYNGSTNRIILAGGVSGGVYKSIDNGATWLRKSPTGSHFSCTSIAQDPRPGFQDTWYYTVGEATGNSAGGGTGASYSGNGVYKSTDNGDSWARLTSSNTSALESFSVAQDYIMKVIVDPTDGNVYIACAATIRRSIDGGTTWTTVLSGPLSFSSQHTDVVVSSTGRLYASFGGTNDSGVDGVWASPPGATSGDAGAWTRIAGAGAGGSPAGWNAEPAYGRVVLAIAPSSENLLYALYYTAGSPVCPGAATEAELFRWDDIGGTWTNLSATLPDEVGCTEGNDPFAVQGGYDLVVAVKPDAPSTIFIGGTNAYRSTDAGLTWTRIGGYASAAGYGTYLDSHADIHSFVFQPGSPLIMLCGNDGGIQRTTDCTAGTVVWTQINTGYRTYQYYHVTLDPRTGNDKVIGGAQDNGTTRNVGGTGSTFEIVFSGDGVAVGLSDVISGFTYEYVGFQEGNIYRRLSTDGPGFGTDITPTGLSGAGLFITLFKLDNDNSQILYYASDEKLYRTTSASTVASGTWTEMTGIGTAIGAGPKISCIATSRGAYSPTTSSLFVGTSSGKVYRLNDPAFVAAGTGPVDITGGAFSTGNVSSISVNPRNDDTVLVTFSSYGVTSAFWTGNANSPVPTWTAVEGPLTLPSYRSSAIAVTATGVDYFVGTSAGLYNATGLPGAAVWVQEGAADLGNAVVTSLALRPSDNRLVAGTHGYGMWTTTLSLAALPVTLNSFNGQLQNNSILLNWSTNTEINTRHFDLEKSNDGRFFRKIATVTAAGNSNSLKKYSYVDNEMLSENNYYRLRTVDLDGKYNMSNIINIKVSDVKQGMIVLGNPFRDKIYVRLVQPPREKFDMRLTDMNGRLISRKQFSSQQIKFDVPASLGKGTYMLSALIDKKTYVTKVIRE